MSFPEVPRLSPKTVCHLSAKGGPKLVGRFELLGGPDGACARPGSLPPSVAFANLAIFVSKMRIFTVFHPLMPGGGCGEA